MPSRPHRANWARLQPTSLGHAIELCKEHARHRLNRSVDRIADAMGLPDKWTLYRYISTGRLPANLIRPYETACGIDYVTRWIAASAGKMLVEMPRGRALAPTDVVHLHNGFGTALQLLTDFYAQPKTVDSGEVLAALTAHLNDIAWHRANITAHTEPELDFASAPVA